MYIKLLLVVWLHPHFICIYTPNPLFFVKGLFHVYSVPSLQLRSSLAVAELEHKRVVQELREQVQKEKACFHVYWLFSATICFLVSVALILGWFL